ncbi:MAG: hypothetical protein ABIR30_13055 [Chitinophagaceae bacterium]
MKKILSIIAITAAVAVVMAACKGNPATTQSISYEDTVGFAQFQAWKVMNERVDPVVAYGTAVAPVAKKVRATSGKSGSMSSSSSHTAETAKKKGWSKAAKYAAIGGGTGAVLGAVINKRNRVAGGVIGAVLGGGLGYGIGRSQDKKDGRY